MPKFHLSKKDWSPITLGEVVYRLEDVLLYSLIADGDDPDEIAALAKLYGKRMGLEGVDTRIVKVIFENEEKQDAIFPILARHRAVIRTLWRLKRKSTRACSRIVGRDFGIR